MDGPLVALSSLLAAAALGHAVVSTAERPSGAPGLVRGVAATAPAAKDALSFDTLLTYDYQKGLVGLPDALKALHGTTVTMRGFLLTYLEYEDIHHFFLVPTHASCCFGMPAGINGMVEVVVRRNERGLPNTNEPIEVRGTFRAVETFDQGLLQSIYRIDEASAQVLR